MDEVDAKLEALKKAYHDKIVGYGSVTSTLKEIKSRPIYSDLNITINDVKKYINNLPHKQLLFKYKGYNSYVAHAFLDQIQLDLADFTDHANLNDGFRFCLIGIDVFSRYAHVIPMKGKTIPDVMAAFQEIVDVIGTPKTIFSDQEGAFNSNEFNKFIKEKNIIHIQTLTHASYAESFIKTLKLEEKT